MGTFKNFVKIEKIIHILRFKYLFLNYVLVSFLTISMNDSSV